MPQDSYRTVLEEIARKRSSIVTVFADFCRIAACVSAAETREEEYFEAIKPYDDEELGKFAVAYALLVQEMEQKPFSDILGPYYAEIASHSSKQARGEFYTPPAVCELMAKMSVDVSSIIEEGWPFTVNDPCSGSGGLILALAKQFSPIVLNGDKSHVDLLRVTCQDINPVAVDMCYVNTTMWGIPATMISGNALTVQANRVWSNIHWHRVGEDQRQACIETERFLTSSTQTEEESAESSGSIQEAENLSGPVQFQLDLGFATHQQEFTK